MSRFYDVLKGTRSSLPPREEQDPDADGLTTLQASEVADILATFDATAPVDDPPSPESRPEPPNRPEAAVADVSGPEGEDILDLLEETVEQHGAPQPEMEMEEVEVQRHAAPPTRQPAPIPAGLPEQTMEMRLDERLPLIPNLRDSMNVEQYRFLRTKLLQQQADRMFRSLLVTSSGVGEGKTVTTLNLALTFAMLPSFKVLVVEGDLRKGGMHHLLGINGGPGFSNLIEGSASLDEVVCKPSELPVRFVLRGNSRLSPAELLHSPQVSLQLGEMAKRFDLVLVDSPPVNLVSDAQLLAASCEAVLLVVKACSTSQKNLEDATRKLQRFRVVGTVLNGTPKMVRSAGYEAYK
jgi:capsular exopolysaccharide synthesis family protein